MINPRYQLSTIKLTENNYLTWKRQIHNAVYDCSLENHIFKDEKPLKKIQRTIESSEAITGTIAAINSKISLIYYLEYMEWMGQDCSWLIGAMSEDIVSQMIGCVTTWEFIFICILTFPQNLFYVTFFFHILINIIYSYLLYLFFF